MRAEPAAMRTISVDNPEFQPGHPGSIRYVDREQNLRDDPVGQMHSRGQLNGTSGDRSDREAVGLMRIEAARTFQRTWEAAGIGMIRSLDFTQEPVDGSPRYGGGHTDRRKKANIQLRDWRELLGKSGYDLIVAVLIEKCSMREFARQRHGIAKQAYETYVGHRFRECLDVLAQDVGLSS